MGAPRWPSRIPRASPRAGPGTGSGGGKDRDKGSDFGQFDRAVKRAKENPGITTGGGDGSVGWTATVLVDLSGGGISTDFEVSLNSDGSGGQSAVTGTGNDFIYIYQFNFSQII